MDWPDGTQHHWSYNATKYFDRHGVRWHFVHHTVFIPGVAYEERPNELYFRDDARERFGVHRLDHGKDNPFRDYEARVRKILNDDDFRESLFDPGTRKVWRRAWLKWSGDRKPKRRR